MSQNDAGHTRKQLQDIRNINNGPSRFKTGTKGKTVRLPGKQVAATKAVFEQRGNVREATDNQENPKRLKVKDSRVAEQSEMKVNGKASSSNPFSRITGKNRVLNKQEMSKVAATNQTSCKAGASKPSTSRKNLKPRLPMPDIPIPIPLSPRIIEEQRLVRNEVNELSTGIKSLLQDVSPNAHSLALQDEWCGNREAIFRHLRAEDELYVVNLTFLCVNSEVKPETRRILIDWIIQVQTYFNLTRKTLHLTIRMMDQFINRRKVALVSYQLVGVTCLLLAAKFEERFPPSLEKLVHMTDNSCTEDDVVRMERTILFELECKIHFPVVTEYLDYFLCAVPITEVLETNADRIRNLCMYLLDLTLPEIHMVQWPAYMVTAAAVCFATKIVSQYCEPEHDGMDDAEGDEGMATTNISSDKDARCSLCQSLDVQCLPDSVLLYYTGTREDQLLPVMQRIAKILSRVDESPFQAATQKYRSHSKYENISEWPGLKTSVVKDIIAVDRHQ